MNDKGKLQKKAEKFGDSKEIGKAVKKREWNTYRITAKGFHFTHYINDVKTTELIDDFLDTEAILFHESLSCGFEGINISGAEEKDEASGV